MLTKGTAKSREVRDRGSGPSTWPPGADPKEHGILGDSPALLSTISRAYGAARHGYRVVIQGETGTGKELVAHYIHKCSGRKGALHILNCALLTPDLAQSHLFGHVRGAFTGATTNERGYFRLADKGTLVLDEIGELHPLVQTMFLRVLSEKTFTPVGGRDQDLTDVRIVSASHADLQGMINTGRFREDLFHRLAEVCIKMPALRDRPEDIIPIAHSIVSSLPRPDGRAPWALSDAAAQLLVPHAWTGNVRDLGNALRASSLQAHEGRIEAHHLPDYLQPRTPTLSRAPPELTRQRILDRLALGAATAIQVATVLGLTDWQVKAGLCKLREDGLVRLHGAGPASWYSLVAADDDGGPPPGPAVDAALVLAGADPGVTSKALKAELGGSLASARRVLQGLERAGRLALVNPGGRELLYRLAQHATDSGGRNKGTSSARASDGSEAREAELMRLRAAPAGPTPIERALPATRASPCTRLAAASSHRADQHTVDEASAVAMDLIAAYGRVTRAMVIEASGASTKTAGRALAMLVKRGRLASGPGGGNQQDYVAVPEAEPTVEERCAGRDARAERVRVERLAMEIASSEGTVTRAGLAEVAGIEGRAAGRILASMVENERLVRVGFGRGTEYRTAALQA